MGKEGGRRQVPWEGCPGGGHEAVCPAEDGNKVTFTLWSCKISSLVIEKMTTWVLSCDFQRSGGFFGAKNANRSMLVLPTPCLCKGSLQYFGEADSQTSPRPWNSCLMATPSWSVPEETQIWFCNIPGAFWGRLCRNPGAATRGKQPLVSRSWCKETQLPA